LVARTPAAIGPFGPVGEAQGPDFGLPRASVATPITLFAKKIGE
jgi:hypothetical protein